MNGENIKRVRDVMTEDYILVDGLATIAEAIAELKQSGAHCMVVQKRHTDDEYGILLMSDVAKHVVARNRSPHRVNVYEIMSKPVITVRPSMDVRYTARMFDNFGLSVAPVLHSGEVLGIVSYDDIVLGTVGEEAPMLPPSAD